MINVPKRKIVDEDGNMTQEFLTWVNQVSGLQMLSGTGSPEGVVIAEQNALYRDEAGSTGTILYVKNLGDIGRDRSLGWILV